MQLSNHELLYSTVRTMWLFGQNWNLSETTPFYSKQIWIKAGMNEQRVLVGWWWAVLTVWCHPATPVARARHWHDASPVLAPPASSHPDPSPSSISSYGAGDPQLSSSWQQRPAPPPPPRHNTTSTNCSAAASGCCALNCIGAAWSSHSLSGTQWWPETGQCLSLPTGAGGGSGAGRGLASQQVDTTHCPVAAARRAQAAWEGEAACLLRVKESEHVGLIFHWHSLKSFLFGWCSFGVETNHLWWV